MCRVGKSMKNQDLKATWFKSIVVKQSNYTYHFKHNWLDSNVFKCLYKMTHLQNWKPSHNVVFHNVLNRFPMGSYKVLDGYFLNYASQGFPQNFQLMPLWCSLLWLQIHIHIFGKGKSKEPIIPKELSTCIIN